MIKTKRIPVYLITGFLGSGKTTLLLQILEECNRKKINPAIVLNELGEANVEKHLFENHQLIELLNGCICCTIQEDLTQEVHSFISSIKDIPHDQQPDMIIVEGTGIANPLEVIEALTHPLLIDQIEVKTIVSLVDASRFLEYQSIFSSSKEIRTILREQITSSPLILLNKIDLVSSSKLAKIRSKINKWIEPTTVIIETNFGQVDVNLVLEPRLKTSMVHISKHGTQHAHNHSYHDEHNHHGNHHHHHSHHLFQTLKLEGLPEIDFVQLKLWLNSLPQTIIRAKGIAKSKEAAGWVHFQFASGELTLNHLKNGVDNTEETCLILIGSELDKELIKESFTKAFSTNEKSFY